jgi:ketosteroid isomerase-like protein
MTQHDKARMVVGLAALAVAAVGCQKVGGDASDPAAIATAIKADEKAWSDEFQAKTRNMEALVGHYADDAYFVAPGVKPASGMTEIRRVYAEGLADPNFNIKFAADKVDVAQAGDMATSQGRFEQTYTDAESKAAVKVGGSFLTVYKKQADGSWKVVQDWAVADPGKPEPVEPGKPAQRAKMVSFSG